MPFARIEMSPGNCSAHMADDAAETVWVATMPLENLEMFERMGVSFPT